VTQLPQDEALVLVSGTPPIRAQKLRYFEGGNFNDRCLPAPILSDTGAYPDRPKARNNDWQEQSRRISQVVGLDTNGDYQLKALAPVHLNKV